MSHPHLSSFFFHLHSLGGGNLGVAVIIWAHQWSAWCATLFTCWMSAVFGGGRRSSVLPFWVKSHLWAWLMHSLLILWSYIQITKHCGDFSQSSMDSGVALKAQSWCDFIVGFPSVPCSLLPYTLKNDTVITSECMEHWQWHDTEKPQCPGYCVSC